ncbi:sensor histidine kinase [Patescibacteria group bacterium]
MNIKKIFNQLNIFAQCRRYGLSFWQCPQFLFLIMGIIIIVTSIVIYAIGNRYIADPEMVALVVLFVSAILFVIANIITQSFERVAEASRMKSEFVSIVSHQLRSPLSNLRWTNELLMSGKIDSITKKQLEYFQILKENIDRMQKLVSDLLIVSRIETATLPLKKREISLENLVKKLILDFKPLIEASNVKMELTAQENLPNVLIDPSQIRLVIENLTDNAIRYTPTDSHFKTDELVINRKEKGIVQMRIEKKNESIYFEIEDNGVGIPKEDQKYIFQKFFRSENILKYQTQGSGLGLYIAKAIIEKSGGKIGFKSKEGKGSTFWFALPIK